MKESSRRMKNVIQLLLLTSSVIKPMGFQIFGPDSSQKNHFLDEGKSFLVDRGKKMAMAILSTNVH